MMKMGTQACAGDENRAPDTRWARCVNCLYCKKSAQTPACARPMNLKHLPADSRPREKLLQRGPAALSDAELLALLLRTGIQGKSVVVMAQELLDQFGGMAGLLHTSADALKTIKGLGPAKRAEVVAVLELARRALAQQMQDKPVFDGPQAVRDYLQLQCEPSLDSNPNCAGLLA